MARIELSKPALADLDGIWDYIAVEYHSPSAADKLLDDIAEAIRMLADFPNVGTSVDDLSPSCRRFAVRKKYLVYYQPVEAGIQVLRVLHGARYIHPGYFD